MTDPPNEGSYRDGCDITIYAPPSTLRIVAPPPTKEEQTLFGFFEEISLSPKKQDRDATTLIPQLQPSRETK
jgi:hypothetical protein